MKASGDFHCIELRPHAGQFFIDELPLLLLCVAAWVYGGMEHLPLGGLATAVALLLSVLLAYRFICLRRIRYCINHELLVCEQGVFYRKVDYIELYRIVDFREHQSLLQQLCGLKTICILSMDRNTSRLEIIGLPRRSDLVPIVRARVEFNKRKRSIYEITNH